MAKPTPQDAMRRKLLRIIPRHQLEDLHNRGVAVAALMDRSNLEEYVFNTWTDQTLLDIIVYVRHVAE